MAKFDRLLGKTVQLSSLIVKTTPTVTSLQHRQALDYSLACVNWMQNELTVHAARPVKPADESTMIVIEATLDELANTIRTPAQRANSIRIGRDAAIKLMAVLPGDPTTPPPIPIKLPEDE